MNETLTRPAHRNSIDRGQFVVVGAAIALFLTTMILVSPLLTSTNTIGSVDIDNPTPWTVRVDLLLDGGWVPVGIVEAGSGTTLLEVPDSGAAWKLRFSSGPVATTARFQRDTIEDGEGSLAVPDSFIEAAELAGLPVSPPGL